MAKKQIEQEQKGILIANPIYDVVFKNLMTTSKGTNKDNAGYFVGSILGEEISDIELLPQEYTYHTKLKKKTEKKKEGETLTTIRLDFIATIRTKNGEFKKVLIEIQKSKKPVDLIRFRTYLGEQYKQQDKLKENKTGKDQVLPIVTIYMLGFALPKVEAVAVKVNRTYIDILSGDALKNKDPFIECLTHDAYFIQVPRINREMYENKEECSDLRLILSLFEQDYFIDENFVKKYPYTITNKNFKKMVDTLEYIASDPITRRVMQEEYWAALNDNLWENEVKILTGQIVAQSDQIAAQSNKIAAQSNKIATQSNTIKTQFQKIAVLQQLLKQAGIDIPST